MEPYSPLGEVITCLVLVILAWLVLFGIPLALLWLLDVPVWIAITVAAIPLVSALVFFLWISRRRSTG